MSGEHWWLVAYGMLGGMAAMVVALALVGRTQVPPITPEPPRVLELPCGDADRLVELARAAERWRCAESIHAATASAFDAGFLAGASGCEEYENEEPFR